MELFQHEGFQTVEFILLTTLFIRMLATRSVTGGFLLGWATLAAAGLAALQLWGAQLPVVPVFVNGWRILITLFGAALLGEFLEEWRRSPGGHAPAHTFGIVSTVAGVGLGWLNNFEVSSAGLLLAGFLGLGYCARENRVG